MSKLLTNLIAKAEKNGEAQINGRYENGMNYTNEIVEKYHIMIQNNILSLRHWGTTTLIINLNDHTVIHYYGISDSDRDSMNFICNHYNIPVRFRYLPSTKQFIMIQKGAN